MSQEKRDDFYLHDFLRKRSNIISTLRGFLVLLGSILFFAKALTLSISSDSAILMNQETGAILYEKNSTQPAYPASITKVATAVFFLEKMKGSLDGFATAIADDVAAVPSHQKNGKHPPHRLEHGGSHIGIRDGESLPLISLLEGLLLSSGNDAANVLARTASGSTAQFMKEMNLFFQKLGVKNSNFCNPHGLHTPDHQVTAYDMALITQYGFRKFPVFREIVRKIQTLRPKTNKAEAQNLYQSNKLLRKGVHYYPKAIGVKTGYTSKAGYTLIAAAEHEGRVLIAVILGGKDSSSRYADAISLFEVAFGEKMVYRTLFSEAQDRFFCPISSSSKTIEAKLGEDFAIGYYPAEEPQLITQISWNKNLLPIEKGEKVGELLVVLANGCPYAKRPIFSVTPLAPSLWDRVCQEGVLLRKIGGAIALLLISFLGIFLIHRKNCRR